jgi:hypothetical protein
MLATRDRSISYLGKIIAAPGAAQGLEGDRYAQVSNGRAMTDGYQMILLCAQWMACLDAEATAWYLEGCNCISLPARHTSAGPAAHIMVRFPVNDPSLLQSRVCLTSPRVTTDHVPR